MAVGLFVVSGLALYEIAIRLGVNSERNLLLRGLHVLPSVLGMSMCGTCASPSSMVAMLNQNAEG
jgi:hypothetical protein